MSTTPQTLDLAGYQFRFSPLPASSALPLTPVVGKVIAAALGIPSVAKLFLGDGKEIDLAKVDIAMLAHAVGEVCDALIGIGSLPEIMGRLLGSTVAVAADKVYSLSKTQDFDTVFTDIGIGYAFQVAIKAIQINFKGFTPAR